VKKALAGSQRTYLRGLAHKLRPVIQVGKNGITPDLIRAVDDALDIHELIKVKFVDFKEEKKELSGSIADQTSSEAVGLIGNVAIFYRQNPVEKKRKITLPAKRSPLSGT
jgi:RNA-binding protein